MWSVRALAPSSGTISTLAHFPTQVGFLFGVTDLFRRFVTPFPVLGVIHLREAAQFSLRSKEDDFPRPSTRPGFEFPQAPNH
jgi:hypothetical protein